MKLSFTTTTQLDHRTLSCTKAANSFTVPPRHQEDRTGWLYDDTGLLRVGRDIARSVGASEELGIELWSRMWWR